MKGNLIKLLKIIIPIGIGVYLTWYFFSGLTDDELAQTKNAFFDANYFWVILSLVLAFLSHLSRAYRWRFLLEPLGYKPKLSNAYHAVMSGYVINYTVPRSGEVARAGLMTNYEKIPFEKGFATIVIERVIDVLMLGVVVLISGLMQAKSAQYGTAETTDGGISGNLILTIVLIGGILGVIGLVFFLKNKKFKAFVLNKLAGFWDGLKSIWTMKKKWPFIFHTLFIWACYVGMIWVSAQAFEETKGLSMSCMFAAFIAGAAAIAAVPGGLGLYPLWITKVLAAYMIFFPAYGIFVWVTQTGLIVVLGLLSLFLIQRQPKLAEVKKEVE